VPAKPTYEELAREVNVLKAKLARMNKVRQALKESEAKYRQLVNHAPSGIYEIDYQNRRFVNVNDVVCEYTGYTREELLAMNPIDIVTKESARLFGERVSRLFVGEKIPDVAEFKIRAKDGREIWVRTHTRVLYENGMPKGATVIVHDISALKSTEEALHESEERYKKVLETIEEGYYEVNLSGNFTFFNDSVCKLLGYTREELMGMNDRSYTDEGNAKDLYRVFNSVYRTGQPFNGFEWQIIRKDGERRMVEASVYPLTDSEGKVTGFSGIARDITDRKRMEEELFRNQKLDSIGKLAGGIAHDFNNLLMGIQGNTSLMLFDIQPGHPHYERLKGIEQHVQSGANLTKQLLGFARGGKYHVKPINPNEVLERTSNMFGRTKKEIRIHHKLQEDVWRVEADQGQVEQVLLNLYVNAWQAMPGGGDVHIETDNVTLGENALRPYSIRPGRYVKISVRDNGVGMDEATRKRIFEPFFTTKEMGRGTGMGLASAYGIIKNHGGAIDAVSEPGKGSTFYIYLPATAKDLPEEAIPSEEILKGEETILFVDDEETILDVSRRMLERMGYKVLTARGGKEALELIERATRDGHSGVPRPHLIVLDLIMPGMSGSETFTRLRKMSSDIKILLSSGYSLSGEARKLMEQGCDGFIQKPFNMKALSTKIREILEEGREKGVLQP
jgi:two-component system cell cycle sensor histidine kinase/response regulator CckA